MKNIAKTSFLFSFAALIYIAVVAIFMQNAEKIFGKMDNIASFIAFLTLFSLSTAVVGGLIVAKPIMLYLDAKKKEAVKLFGATIAWLAGYLIIGLIYLLIKY